jgi:hypothetical protein
MRILEAMSFLAALGGAIIVGAVMTGKLDKPALVIAVDLCIVTAIFQMVSFIVGRGLQKRLKQGRDEAEHEAALRDDGHRLQLAQAETGNLVPPASVTEGTTAILEPAARRARGDRGGDR